jgi:hypothetical protein
VRVLFFGDSTAEDETHAHTLRETSTLATSSFAHTPMRGSDPPAAVVTPGASPADAALAGAFPAPHCLLLQPCDEKNERIGTIRVWCGATEMGLGRGTKPTLPRRSCVALSTRFQSWSGETGGREIIRTPARPTRNLHVAVQADCRTHRPSEA